MVLAAAVLGSVRFQGPKPHDVSWHGCSVTIPGTWKVTKKTDAALYLATDSSHRLVTTMKLTFVSQKPYKPEELAKNKKLYKELTGGYSEVDSIVHKPKLNGTLLMLSHTFGDKRYDHELLLSCYPFGVVRANIYSPAIPHDKGVIADMAQAFTTLTTIRVNHPTVS